MTTPPSEPPHGAETRGAETRGAETHSAETHSAGSNGAGSNGAGSHGAGSHGAGSHGAGSHGAGSHGPTVGPLALEAALLLDVVAERLSSMKASTQVPGSSTGDREPETQSPTGTTAAGTAAGADGRCPECGSVPGASCTACPVCRFMALLRGERPEATARLVDGALMIIRTLRSLVPDPPDPAAATAEPGSQHSGHQQSGQQASAAHHPGRHGGLEHIDIS